MSKNKSGGYYPIGFLERERAAMEKKKNKKGILGNENAFTAGLADTATANAVRVDQEKAQKHVGGLLTALGFDWQRDPNMKETPKRVAKMFATELFKGCYTPAPKFTAFPNTRGFDEMVIVPNITIHSVCSHHLVAFSGVCHVGYVPSLEGKLCGLSKIARVVEWFARRPQIQEELTTQIADFLQMQLDPMGVMVVIDAQHGCMTTRGVLQAKSSAITSKVLGCFKTNSGARAEFLSLVGKK